MTIQELRALLVELTERGKSIQAKADAEKRPLTTDEQTEIEGVFAEFENVEADISRRERIAAQEDRLAKPQARAVVPMQSATDVVVPGGAGLKNSRMVSPEDRQRWGFRNFGEFCAVVRAATVNPGGMDPRLLQNALGPNYGNETVGADGGFAVPPEWRSTIMDLVAGEDSLVARCDVQNVSGNTITFPVDETTAWQTTGGIQAYWDTEASVIQQSKPLLKEVHIKLGRITALVPVTQELLEDAAAMGSYVAQKAGEKIAYKVNDAIINGDGSGKPLGILAAPCTVSVAKETAPAQVAGSFFGVNAVKMMARLPAQSFARATWLINQDVLPSILQGAFVVKNADNTAAGAGALYMGPNGLAGSSAYGSLLGRPIVVTEACATLGTVGDVILADLSQYLVVNKASGLQTATSIHMFFDQNAVAFRFVLRINGQPWLSAPIARASGSNTLSHFVTLATR